jgi:hypothetical protein
MPYAGVSKRTTQLPENPPQSPINIRNKTGYKPKGPHEPLWHMQPQLTEDQWKGDVATTVPTSYGTLTTHQHYNYFDPGYEQQPSYWEIPQNIAIAHNMIKSLLPGEAPPAWMDVDSIEQAYKYLSYANGNEDWANWKYLAPNDPGRGLLQSLGQPPLSETDPHLYEISQAYNEMQLPAEQRDFTQYPTLPSEIRNYLEGLTQQETQQVNYDQNAPAWMQAAGSITDNPWASNALLGGTTGLVLGGIGGGPIGAAIGAVGGGAIGGVLGGTQQLYETHPNLANALSGGLLGASFGLIGGLPGAAIGGAIGTVGGEIYGLITGKSAAEMMINVMFAPADAVQRVLGVAIQYDLAKKNPELYGSPDEILQNFGAAYRAGSIAYSSGAVWKMITQQDEPTYQPIDYQARFNYDIAETFGGETLGHTDYVLQKIKQNPINILPAMNEILLDWGLIKGDVTDITYLDPYQTFQLGISPYPMDLDAVGAASMVEMRRRLAAGEDYATVAQEYKQVFGFPGQASELAGLIILNPLNKFGEFSRKAVETGAKLSGNELLATAMRSGKGGVFEGVQRYKDLIKSGIVLDDATAAQKSIVGWNDESLQYKINEPSTKTNPILRWGENLMRRTPVSAAEKNVETFVQNMSTIGDQYLREGDYRGFANVMERVAESPSSAAYEMDNAVLGNMDTYSVHGAIKAIAPDLRVMADIFERTTVPRTVLERVSNILGETRTDVLKLLGSEDGANMVMSRLEEVLKTVDSAEAKGLLEEISAGRFTARDLQTIADTYEVGPNGTRIPMDIGELFGQMIASSAGKAERIIGDAYGVTASPKWQRFATAMKRAQSIALLNWNPTYFLGNLVNNTTTMVATDLWKGLFSSPAVRERFWEDFGIKPTRLHAGIGYAAIPEVEIEAGKTSMPGVGSELSKLTQPPNDLINGINRGLARVGKVGPASQAAKWLEQSMGERAVYQGTKQAIDSLWKFQSEKFVPSDKMARWNSYDPAIAGTLESAIRNNITTEGMIRDLTSGEMKFDLARALQDTAGIGVDQKILQQLVDYFGIEDKIKSAKSTAEINSIFNDLRQNYGKFMDEISRQDVQTRAQEMGARVSSGQLTEVVWAHIENSIRNETEQVMHDRTMMDAHAVTDQMRMDGVSGELINQYWKTVFSEEDSRYFTSNLFNQATMRGMLDGMGVDSAAANLHMTDMLSQENLWRDFYSGSRKLTADFLKKLDGFETSLEREKAWKTVLDERDRLHNDTVSEVANIQQRMNDRYVEIVRAQYGDEAANIARKWLNDDVTYGQDRGKMIDAQMKKMRDLSWYEQRQSWTDFYNKELLPMTTQHYMLGREGAIDLWHYINGDGKPPEEILPPEQPAPQAPAPEAPIAPAAPQSVAEPHLLTDAEIAVIKEDARSLVGMDKDNAIVDIFNQYNGTQLENIQDIGMQADWSSKMNEAFKLENQSMHVPKMSDAEFKAFSEKLRQRNIEIPERPTTEIDEKWLKQYKRKLDKPENAEKVVKVNNIPETDIELTPEQLASTPLNGDLPADFLNTTIPVQHLGELHREAYGAQIKPALDTLEQMLIRNGMSGGGKIPDEILPEVMQFIKHDIAGKLTTTKAAAMKYGMSARDYALLDYSDQRGVDSIANVVFPYQFWYTRTMINWMMRMVDRPAWYANYYRLRSFMNSAQASSGFPTRLANKMALPAPYLPEWAGSNLYFDPLNNVFPFEQFVSGLSTYAQNATNQEREAMTVLAQWRQEGTITQSDMTRAIQMRTGPLWDRAMAQVQANGESQTYDPFQYISMVLSPAIYLSYPYFFATGHTLSINPQKELPILPVTRTGQAIQAATADSPLAWLGKFIGGALAAPETAIRKASGVSEFGAYGDYYIDRMLANMVGDGTITYDQAITAMTERTGPTYETARNRVMLETAVKVPGAVPTYAALHPSWDNPMEMGSALLFNLFPASILPKGELEERGLYDEYQNAGNAYRAGDKDAYNKFFEKYPEYQARLALWDTPDERLRQFMISGIWDAWSALGKTEKGVVTDTLGTDFRDNFLNDQTRNYELVDTETLAGWARMLNLSVPRTEQTAPVLDAPDIDYTIPFDTPEEYAEVDAYKNLRGQLFPNWYAIQQRYYNFPPGSQERRDFLAQFPELKDYWDWNRNYKAAHPNIEKYITPPEDTAQLPQYDYSFAMEITPVLARQLYAYYYADKNLTDGGLSELNRIWRKYNKVGGTFENFLDVVVKGIVAPPTALQ